jgi:hypothetical protein
MFLAYVQRFDIVPQPNPQRPSQKGSYVEPSTGMYCLKRAQRSDGSFFGDVIALEHIRALVDLIPRFGEAAEKRLSKETVLDHVSEFRLNKYFEKELFYALQ